MSEVTDPKAWVAKAEEDYVLARNPGGEPTSDEAREALETAQAVRRFMRRTLGIK